MTRNTKVLFILITAIAFSACRQDLLDVKPDKALVVPATLDDFQSLLDNSEQVFNCTPGLVLTASDDYYTAENTLSTLQGFERNSYLWNADIFEGKTFAPDWSRPYVQVLFANVVLEGLDKMDNSLRDTRWKNLRGTALFYRAYAFYHLAQMFAAPYQEATAESTPGIPVRLNSNVNEKSRRGNLKQTYDRVITDLMEAGTLLPVSSTYKTRPDRVARHAMLSRVYLNMGRFAQAGQYADSCISSASPLLDYNTLDTLGTARSFPDLFAAVNRNPEVLFYSSMPLYTFPTGSALIFIDSALYKQYHVHDLRRKLFFRDRGNATFTFRGTYSGSAKSDLFSGLSLDEIYLNRAECYARNNETGKARADLNHLLQHRWKRNTFTAVTEDNAGALLKVILTERRKQLVTRGIRWSDLRRLNLEPSQSTTIRRMVGGREYLLRPKDQRYVFPIPDDEIGPDMPQTPR